MYQLHPCAEWQRFKATSLPEPKKNPDGSPVYEQYTRPGDERQVLLDFKILPDKVSFIVATAISQYVLMSLDLNGRRLVVPRIRSSYGSSDSPARHNHEGRGHCRESEDERPALHQLASQYSRLPPLPPSMENDFLACKRRRGRAEPEERAHFG